MCLGIPGLIIKTEPENKKATVEIFGVQQEVSTMLVKDVAPGEYVLVHTGYAVEKVDLEEAKKQLELWKEVLDDATPK